MADEQMSFAKSANFDRYAKTTRRAKFLDEMDRILPWRSSATSFGRTIRQAMVAGRRSISNACCGFTFFNSGSI